MVQPKPVEYRIDELARLAGTTVRNVRAYQDRGLLPAPRREGRVGLYAETHLARLRLIGVLLSRGYTLANIAELVAGWEQGRELSELLGLESALIGPWSDESASTISRTDVVDYLGDEVTDELLEQASRHRLVEIEGDQVRVDNPRMLEGAALLVGAGVPVADVLELGVFLADAVDQIARRYVDLIKLHVFPDPAHPLGDADIPHLTDVVRQLRPLAKQVVDAELAIAIERRIQTELGDRLSRFAPSTPEESAG